MVPLAGGKMRAGRSLYKVTLWHRVARHKYTELSPRRGGGRPVF